MNLLILVLTNLSLPFLLCWFVFASYLLALALLSMLGKSPRNTLTGEAPERKRFCILIPAHNEGLNLGAVLDKLQSVEYPKEYVQIVVIADNCDDNTAEVAESAGARVLVRQNEDLRGKGYALEWAIDILLKDEFGFDAFLVMDADSVLSANFLETMNLELLAGMDVLQGYYGVLNTDESWRTKLMAVALALAHYVKPCGRNVLGLSDGLKGNGMVFSRKAMLAVPWSGESVTEDIDHTLRLIEKGFKIRFLQNAVVEAQMPTTGDQAKSQRQRWEGGRYGLIKRALKFFAISIFRFDLVGADRAMELIIPPFAELFAVPVIFLAVFGFANVLHMASPITVLVFNLWQTVILLEFLYLVIGLIVAKVPISTASSLIFAPYYIVWKIAVVLSLIAKRGVGGWKRTERRTL